MNYKQSAVSGVSWVRCKAVTVTNPLDPVVDPILGTSRGPTAYFQEEKVVNVDGSNILTDVGSCQKEFQIEAEIPLLDPNTGLPTGKSVTHGELYTILFSLYMQTAVERDSA